MTEPIKVPCNWDMHIQHNGHRVNAESIMEYLSDGRVDITDEELAKATAEDSIWEIQWYPDGPTSFFCVGASTFDAALAAANAVDND